MGPAGVLVGGAAVAAAIVRLLLVRLHRAHFRSGFHGDASVHFTIIQQLQRDHRSRYVGQYLISPEPMSYPLAFHRICRWVPQNFLQRHSYFPNLVIFTVFAAGFAAAAPALQAAMFGTTSLLVTGVALGLVLVSPSQLTLLGPGIAYLGLSERLLARLSCSGFFLAVMVWMAGSHPVALIAAVAFGALTIASSIFGRQVILFVSPFMAVFSWQWKPLAAAALAFAAALLVSRDHLYRGLRHTVLQWRLYATHTKTSTLVRSQLSSYTSWEEVRAVLPRVRRVLGLLIRREPMRAAIFYPELLLLIGLGLATGDALQVGRALWALIASVLLVYGLTSTSWLNHLGESYRYIEYAATFAVPLGLARMAVLWGGPGVVLLAGLLLYDLVFFGVVHHFLVPRATEEVPDPLGRFLAPLGLDDRSVVFPVTMRLGADICARTDAKSFWWQPGIIAESIYDRFVESYPYLKSNYQPLFKAFGVTHVVCEKAALGGNGVHYDFRYMPKIAEDARYVAYRVDSERTTATGEDVHYAQTPLRGIRPGQSDVHPGIS